MTPFVRPRRGAGLLALVASLATAPALAQDKPASIPPDGFQAVRAILRYHNLEPLADGTAFNREAPGNVVLIVLGKPAFLFLREMPESLQNWVRRGGAALVASDGAEGTWRSIFGIHISGQFLQEAPGKSYRNLPDCPFVHPEAGANPPLFRGLTRVATNCPSYMGQSDELPLLARLPADCFIKDTNYGPRLANFAVGGDYGQGRALVLADHSLFINDMLLKTDNDNLPLALQCVQWLAKAGNGARKKVLLVEEGAIVTTLDYAFRETPLPTPKLPSMPELVNRTLYELEQKNALPNFLNENVRPGRLFYIVVIVLTGLLALLGLATVMRNRHRPEQGLPRPTAAAPTHQASVVDQRHQAMLHDGNFWEAARTSAQHGLAAFGAASSMAAPQLVVEGSWWQRRRLRRQVTQLWQLAYGPEPRRISLAEFARLSDLLAGVQTAWRAGRWRFASPNPVP